MTYPFYIERPWWWFGWSKWMYKGPHTIIVHPITLTKWICWKSLKRTHEKETDHLVGKLTRLILSWTIIYIVLWWCSQQQQKYHNIFISALFAFNLREVFIKTDILQTGWEQRNNVLCAIQLVNMIARVQSWAKDDNPCSISRSSSDLDIKIIFPRFFLLLFFNLCFKHVSYAHQ